MRDPWVNGCLFFVSRSGGSVSPPAATVVANKRKSNPSRPTRRNQPTHNNGRQDLGEPDGLVDQSASSQFRLLRGVPPGGRSGGGGRTRQLSAASSIESNSSFNSNHSAGGDAAPPSSRSVTTDTFLSRAGPGQFLEQQKQVRFQQTHNQGLRQLFCTVSWDLHK